MKNPWIYRQIADLLAGRDVRQPTAEERLRLILRHFRLLLEEEQDAKQILHKLRTFTGWYTHGLTHGRDLRVRINSLRNPEQFIATVERFFEEAPDL